MSKTVSHIEIIVVGRLLRPPGGDTNNALISLKKMTDVHKFLFSADVFLKEK